ncbi:aldose 1-epimerase family protein [Niabella aquatica]
MVFTIGNSDINISVAAKGAELQSIKHLKTGQEYMWSGDPAFWGKYSPVLFPVVGTLKEDTCYFEGRAYQMPRHGFARDMVFGLYRQTSDTLSFLLESSADTLSRYPFPFHFFIDYSIEGQSLHVTYRVVNTGSANMYFSVGGHPAFRVPLFEGDSYEDYILLFNEIETAGKWPITSAGLLEKEAVPFFRGQNSIRLQKQLFEKDAIVLKHLKSNSVQLLSQRSGKGFRFDFPGFPYLGIWASKNADFVCIEPWCGVADSVTSDQQLINKEGINSIGSEDEFVRTWSFTVI